MKKYILLSIIIILSALNEVHSQDTLGWKMLPPVAEHVRDFYGLYFFNKDSGWICGWQRIDRNYTFLASTYDGGNNWQTMQVGEKTNLYDVYFINDSIGFAWMVMS